MKVLVAGATGALGVPTARALVEAGHHVIGTTRHENRRGFITALGAEAEVMDALDRAVVARVVLRRRPDAIVQLLTALPERGPSRVSDFTETNRLRTHGTANLVAAAGEARVERYVSESVVVGYLVRGERLATEDDPFAETADENPMRAVSNLESAVRGSGGVVLRFGLLYGESTGTQRYLERLARRGALLLPKLEGALPWVHAEDAARAVVAAIEHGRAGSVYNVAGEESAGIWEFCCALAESIGTRPPRRMPAWMARLVMPYTVKAFDKTLRVSSARARAELGWTPLFPTLRDGLRTS